MVWRLVIARHSVAHSDHELGDHERELTEDGIKLAAQFGEAMTAAAIQPSMALCSSATRAVQTVTTALASDNNAIKPSCERELFQCMYSSWIDHLQGIDDEIESVLAVGHAPTLGRLIAELTGKNVPMPACCAYLLEYDKPWRLLGTTQPRTKLLFAGAS